ncbi:hypothetical protein MKW98_022154 [Papaver atlanticum]|uniref:Uncharacterized protein n=1 Tax=Papaver atlanticum TaxID=357466 RepID=A0AAD4XNW7_9MAGN|nr:hypothetical protein MKW98_022154 [Papaver atlanticum]
MGSSSMKLVMALALCLLLLGGFSAEAAGRINNDVAAAIGTNAGSLRIVCVHPEEKCPSTKKDDCTTCCTSIGYFTGRAVFGLCCCAEFEQ